MITTKSPLFLIKIGLIITFLMHGLPGMIDGSVNDFGLKYLDAVGFAPVGLYLAWLVKLSHVALVIALVLNRYVRPLAYLTMFILAVGIWMVHLPDGWYVIGGGRNGVEFNVFLILALLSVALEKKIE
jgi:putative oxidoreductase